MRSTGGKGSGSLKYAIIGGTGVYDPQLLEDLQEKTVETPYGEITVQTGRYQGHEIAFMPRHGKGHSVPPHKINYRANIWGLKALGVQRILATAAVGSLNPDMEPGHFVFVDQFLDFTKGRVGTFFDGDPYGVVHIDMTEPYCPRIRDVLVRVAQKLDLTAHSQGVYVCVEGPRFETPAEIRAYRMLGADVAGMTNVPEVVLAREAGMCYAAMAMVTNMAAGISKTPLTHEEVLEVMAANTAHVRQLAMETIVALERGESQVSCRCSEVPSPLKGLGADAGPSGEEAGHD